MSKLLTLALLITAFPLFGVNFQLINYNDSQITATVKEALVTDAGHADDSEEDDEGEITYYSAGLQIVAGPITIAHNATADFNIPDENQYPFLDIFSGIINHEVEVYRYIIVIEWNEGMQHKETRTLIGFFDVPNFTPRLSVDANGYITITQESRDELVALINHQAEETDSESDEEDDQEDAPEEEVAPATPQLLPAPEEEIKTVPPRQSHFGDNA